MLRDIVGIDQVLFGTDFPYLRRDLAVNAKERILESSELNDSERRAVLGGNASRLFHVFIESIDRIAGEIRATHTDLKYQPIGEPEELGNAGRIKWVEGRPGEAPAVAGTDFIIARDGRIAAIYLFFDKLS